MKTIWKLQSVIMIVLQDFSASGGTRWDDAMAVEAWFCYSDIRTHGDWKN